MTIHRSHSTGKFQSVNPAYFVGIALVSGAVCVFALRANNQHMIQLRDKVYAADKSNQDVQAPLKELQQYVTSHMNTNLSTGTSVYPPIQLKYTYERLLREQSDAIAAANNAIYSTAQKVCEQQNPTDFSGRNRIPCIEAYVQSNTTPSTPIPDALYKFSFVTPRWSPDLAGWSMVLAIISIGIGALVFIVHRLNRR